MTKEVIQSKAYQEAKQHFQTNPKVWVVTGVAGFIGSHLMQALLELDQEVRGIDNFSTGFQKNIDLVLAGLSPAQRNRFSFIKGDVTEAAKCREITQGAHMVLHHAALGSVPRSIRDPVASNRSNVEGFLQILAASTDAKVERFVYASSSSVYGDSPVLPKQEDVLGTPLSPYAVTKRACELYAEAFAKLGALPLVGLRYFNVYGPRQNPTGEYSAVIPRWLNLLVDGKPCTIYGDGQTSRDFCYVGDVVQANILAAQTTRPEALNTVYNIAVGQKTTLNKLYEILCGQLSDQSGRDFTKAPVYELSRKGDIVHSLADIQRAQGFLGYKPGYTVPTGLEEAISAFLDR